jgi:hypothetical protein
MTRKRLPTNIAKSSKEELWTQAKKRGPFSNPEEDSIYIYADKALEVTITCSDLVKGLEYLTRVTGDEAFRTAALAIKAYGLSSGGLQEETKRMLKKALMTVEDFMAPMMTGGSVSDAEKAAIEYGVPGPSFDTVTRKLRNARKSMEADPARIRGLPEGDTGRKMLVRFACPTVDLDGKQLRSYFGIAFDDDGFAVVLDNGAWRRAINHGQFVSLGFLGDGEPPEDFKRSAWRNFNTRNPSE